MTYKLKKQHFVNNVLYIIYNDLQFFFDVPLISSRYLVSASHGLSIFTLLCQIISVFDVPDFYWRLNDKRSLIPEVIQIFAHETMGNFLFTAILST